MGSPSDYAVTIAHLRAPLAHDIIRYATLAANGHNKQRWWFRLDSKRIDIIPDFFRRTPVVDPDDGVVSFDFDNGPTLQSVLFGAIPTRRPVAAIMAA